jgi:F-type H+-transporting ATPase subunit b
LKLSISHPRTPPARLVLPALFMLLFPLGGMTRVLECGSSLVEVGSQQSAVGSRRADAYCLLPTADRLLLTDGQEGSAQGEKSGESNGEPHALLYKIVNFLILVGALGYLLWKPLGDFFRQRAQTITESLQQGRHALGAAHDRLSAIEARLANLDAEIRAFKDSAAHEMEADLQRLRQAAREESERTLTFARLQMEVATRAAGLELKRYTALEAVTLAEGIIRQRLDDQGRRRLVSRFIEGLGGRTN